MKTKQLALLLLGLVLAVSAFATKTPKVNMVTLNDTMVYVTASVDPGTRASIFVKSDNNKVWYQKRWKAVSSVRSVLDLSELENGMYTISLKSGNNSHERKVKVTDGKIKVQKYKPDVNPVFVDKKTKVMFTHLNFNRVPITMQLYNRNSLVFQDDLGDSFNIQRAFDVSHLVKGDYEFVFTDNGNNYSYCFKR